MDYRKINSQGTSGKSEQVSMCREHVGIRRTEERKAELGSTFDFQSGGTVCLLRVGTVSSVLQSHLAPVRLVNGGMILA